nr:unnamed protein product [Callosobruchus analis]
MHCIKAARSAFNMRKEWKAESARCQKSKPAQLQLLQRYLHFPESAREAGFEVTGNLMIQNCSNVKRWKLSFMDEPGFISRNSS